MQAWRRSLVRGIFIANNGFSTVQTDFIIGNKSVMYGWLLSIGLIGRCLIFDVCQKLKQINLDLTSASHTGNKMLIYCFSDILSSVGIFSLLVACCIDCINHRQPNHTMGNLGLFTDLKVKIVVVWFNGIFLKCVKMKNNFLCFMASSVVLYTQH